MSDQTMICPRCKGAGWLHDEDGQQRPVCTPKDGSLIGGAGRIPSSRLPSYQPCEICGEDCPFGTAEEPCWGMATRDSYDEPHCCSGHSVALVPYQPSTEKMDQ